MRRSTYGDIALGDYKRIEPIMAKTVDSLNKAAVGGRKPRSSTTWRGLGSSRFGSMRSDSGIADRYAHLPARARRAFPQHRRRLRPADASDLTPGQVAAAVIVGADTNAAPQAVHRRIEGDRQEHHRPRQLARNVRFRRWRSSWA